MAEESSIIREGVLAGASVPLEVFEEINGVSEGERASMEEAILALLKTEKS